MIRDITVNAASDEAVHISLAVWDRGVVIACATALGWLHPSPGLTSIAHAAWTVEGRVAAQLGALGWS